MKKLLRLLFRILILALLFIAGVFLINTISFSSRQVNVIPEEPIHIEDSAIERLAASIRIPTVSSSGVIDTAAFRLLDSFLWKNYPLVDSLLEREKINDFSYILKWAGQNSRLAPLLLMAHLDVVGVENDGDSWQHPPFAAVTDDGYLHGRGALDDKLSVCGILEAVELLLAVDYLPQRTIYIAFGHDEEIGGENGAKAIAETFKKRGIQFEYVLDEGSLVVEEALPGCDPPVALIGITEKGYVSVDLTVVSTEGGHSSMPKDGSAINLLSEAIVKLKENPPPAKIEGVMKEMLGHIGPEMDLPQKIIFANLFWTGGLVVNQMEAAPTSNALLRTTLAPTIISSGFKDNVIPTEARATINCRILPGETVQSTLDYIEKVLSDERISIKVNEASQSSEPPPLSDMETFGYAVLQSTIRQIYPEAIVAPSIVVATTDSRHFTTVSNNIYRFLPVVVTREQIGGIHGLNERIAAEEYRNTIRFYRQLIMNSSK